MPAYLDTILVAHRAAAAADGRAVATTVEAAERELDARRGRGGPDGPRAACRLPVLRKDFTVGPLDVCDARLMGADAVLLIVAALDDAELADLLRLARTLALAPLVEVHDEPELDRALAAGADLVGVNQRDLRTFEVDRERALRMGERMPEGVVAVAESGIRGAADVERLASVGYAAVLVGETLVRSADRSSAVDGLLGARA